MAVGIVLVLLPHVPGLDTDFGRSLLTQMAIAAVFSLSFNLLYGQTGLLSFGHAVYFGLGAYAAIIAMRAINRACRCQSSSYLSPAGLAALSQALRSAP